MNDRAIEATILQTLDLPILSIDEARDHANALTKLVNWDAVGILCDDVKRPSTVLVLMLAQGKVVAVCRHCLPPMGSASALKAYVQHSKSKELIFSQARELCREDISDLESLSSIWQQAESKKISHKEVESFFESLDIARKDQRQHKKISKSTRQRVLFDAHGRCMFKGCGIDLNLDPLTGQSGNFAYFAHNVATSEQGPRGDLYQSDLLADEPSNILLLCDVHHRLIDFVAKTDYPIDRLRNMRSRFCDDVNQLLDGLTRPKIPAYCVSWPVHQQVISAPTRTQIAEALVPIGARLDGHLRMLNDNEKTLRNLDPNDVWPLMPKLIESTAFEILAQSHNELYHAALFAMGLMPALIALGALLGNKNAISPMLFHRETGLWYWPRTDPQESSISVSGVEDLTDNCKEITLQIALTAHPSAFTVTSSSLGNRIVTVEAKRKLMGNGALGHPVEGQLFRQHIQELLHRLRENHGVHTVHLLPCASNAACVYLGQAYDSYHPKLVIYDFNEEGDDMIERLTVRNKKNRCLVELC